MTGTRICEYPSFFFVDMFHGIFRAALQKTCIELQSYEPIHFFRILYGGKGVNG